MFGVFNPFYSRLDQQEELDDICVHDEPLTSDLTAIIETAQKISSPSCCERILRKLGTVIPVEDDAAPSSQNAPSDSICISEFPFNPDNKNRISLERKTLNPGYRIVLAMKSNGDEFSKALFVAAEDAEDFTYQQQIKRLLNYLHTDVTTVLGTHIKIVAIPSTQFNCNPTTIRYE